MIDKALHNNDCEEMKTTMLADDDDGDNDTDEETARRHYGIKNIEGLLFASINMV